MTPLDATPNLIQQVYDRILSAIIDHTLAPGARIRQQELAKQLGVSRQPVSHALHLLHRQGLVVESGRKGFQVTPVDAVGVRQLYEVRSALDGLAARLAARRVDVDAPGRTALEAALAAGHAITSRTPLAALIALDVDFHCALYRLSGNPAIEATTASQWPHICRAMAVVLTDEAHRGRVWAEHRVIGACVLAGDAVRAEAEARIHAIEAGLATERRLQAPRQAA